MEQIQQSIEELEISGMHHITEGVTEQRPSEPNDVIQNQTCLQQHELANEEVAYQLSEPDVEDGLQYFSLPQEMGMIYQMPAGGLEGMVQNQGFLPPPGMIIPDWRAGVSMIPMHLPPPPVSPTNDPNAPSNQPVYQPEQVVPTPEAVLFAQPPSPTAQMEHYIAQLKQANVLPTGCGECYYVVPNYMPNGIQCISVNVSPAGLITVFMANDVSVEMTLDHTVRLVNHRHHSVAAATGLGDLSSICHCAGQIYNEETITECSLLSDRKVRLSNNDFLFSSSSETYAFRDQRISIGQPNFRDLHTDMTITLLYSSGGYGPHLHNQLVDIARNTVHVVDVNGVLSLRVNDVILQQRPDGDVIVRYSGNYLRTSINNGSVRVDTVMAELAVDGSWRASVYRDDCKMWANLECLSITADDYEFGLQQNRKLFIRQVTCMTETIIVNGNRVDHSNGKDPILNAITKPILGHPEKDNPSRSQEMVWSADHPTGERGYRGNRRRGGMFENGKGRARPHQSESHGAIRQDGNVPHTNDESLAYTHRRNVPPTFKNFRGSRHRDVPRNAQNPWSNSAISEVHGDRPSPCGRSAFGDNGMKQDPLVFDGLIPLK